MDLTILMIFTNSANKSHSYTKRIEFCGIKDFKYKKDFISFIEYGRLSETNIKTENVIEFSIDYSDNLYD